MMRDDILDDAKPEFRQSGEDFSLIGDQGRQDNVKGRNPIAGDQQELVAQIVNIANFAAIEKF
jgi:hypothetical protein